MNGKPSPGEEPVEIVDEHGRVVDIVTRSAMRAENMRHRAVFVVVRSPDGERLLGHQRAAWKDVFPGHWDIAFGGVPAVGETWEDAAQRELAEEAGVTVGHEGLHRLGSGAYEDQRVRLVGEVFEVRSEGPFTFTDDEVVAVEWTALGDLHGWVASRPVVPDSVAIVVPLLLR